MAQSGRLDVCLRVENVSKHFGTNSRLFPAKQPSFYALSDVSFYIYKGEWFGLVGESGSGKTTLARIVSRLETASDGDVEFMGSSQFSPLSRSRAAFARYLQYVYQDPIGSLNPRMSVMKLIGEPLRVRRDSEESIEKRVRALLEDVGLDFEIAHKRPRELSGGQCQRVGLARAFALEPEVLVLDEPTSSLDVSVQAQVVDLLKSFEETREFSVMMISHDLALVSQVCHRIAVLQQGHLVEIGPTADVIERPQHPYTERLVNAVPVI